MLEPSKPRPSVKASSSKELSGTLKCCQVPGRSTNLMSTTLTPAARALSSTSDGLVLGESSTSTAILPPAACLVGREKRQMHILFSEQGRRDVGFAPSSSAGNRGMDTGGQDRALAVQAQRTIS